MRYPRLPAELPDLQGLPWLKTIEVCQILGVSRQRVHQLAAEGKLVGQLTRTRRGKLTFWSRASLVRAHADRKEHGKEVTCNP